MIFEQSLHRRPIFDQLNGEYRAEASWGFIQGDNTTSITTTVSFTVAFSAAPLVYVTGIGSRASLPSAYTDFVARYGSGGASLSCYSISTSQFTVNITGSGAYAVGSYYGFFWQAIGEK